MTLLIAAVLAWAAHAEPVCAVRTTILRRNPSDAAPVSWRVARYMPFLRIEKKNGWVKVRDLEGETHWARGSDLTTSIRCVVVKSNVAALHQEPSSNSPAADFKTVDRYTPFQRLGDQTEWVRVKDEAGRIAWVASTQVWKPVVVNTMSF